jgi:hypothetical protein
MIPTAFELPRTALLALVVLSCIASPHDTRASGVESVTLPCGVRLLAPPGPNSRDLARTSCSIETATGWSASRPALDLRREHPYADLSPTCLAQAIAAEAAAYQTDPAGTVPAVDVGDRWSGVRTSPVPGLLHWTERAPGFETGALDAIVANELVDRIRLFRIDPARFSIGVNVEVTADTVRFRPIDEWLTELHAVVAINGSYYGPRSSGGPRGLPMTPTLAQGRRLDRSRSYRSSSGAFFAGPTDPSLPPAKFVDCRNGCDGLAVLRAAENRPYQTAFFSYPTLVDFTGRTRAHGASPARRATRAFIAQDRTGHVLIGQTEGGFFTLPAFGDFLLAATALHLRYALNLDGGSGSGMAAGIGTFHYTNSRNCTYESIVEKTNGIERERYMDRNCDPNRLMPLIVFVRPR